MDSRVRTAISSTGVEKSTHTTRWTARGEHTQHAGRREETHTTRWTSRGAHTQHRSSFLRFFAADDAETKAKIEKADAAAAELLKVSLQDVGALRDKAAALEARDVLAGNRAAVARDASDKEPKTQPFITRCGSVASADEAIDAALAALKPRSRLRRIFSFRKRAELSGDAKTAAAGIAGRLCAPRDMGAPACAALRHVLLTLAE